MHKLTRPYSRRISDDSHLSDFVFTSRSLDGNRTIMLSPSILQPQGGVQSGQMLEVPLLQASSSLSEEDGGCEEPTDQHQKWHQQREPSSVPSPSSSSAMPLSPGPSGQWKDGLFSCFRLGFLHPHLWNAWLCPQVLLGQILVRIDMTWLLHHSDDPNGIPVVLTTATALGSNSNIRRKKRSQRCATTCSASSSPRISTTASPVPGASNSKDASAFRSSFRIIMILFLLLSLYDAFIAPPLFELRLDHRSGELELVLRAGDYPVWHHCIYLVLSLPATVWGVWVMVRLRASVRHRYGIPTGRLGRWEDLVCVSLCNCCVMSQIARQTADYETLHPASCCSPNGLLVPRGDSPSDAEGVAAPVASKRAPTVAFVFKARPSSRSTSSTSATCSFSSSSTSSSTSSASSFVGFSRRRGNSTAPASSTPSQPSSSLPSPPDGTGTAHRDVDVPRCRRVGSPDLCVATVV